MLYKYIMKNYLFLLVIILINTFSFESFAEIKKGMWEFVKDSDYCYIGSAPNKIDMPEGKKRGDTYILVYRLNHSKDAIVQISAGYPYKKDLKVSVIIDKSNFNFYSEDDTAWTNDDNKVIFAMKKGLELSVVGESSRGTKTKDIYTLNGFTAAYNKLFKDC